MSGRSNGQRSEVLLNVRRHFGLLDLLARGLADRDLLADGRHPLLRLLVRWELILLSLLRCLCRLPLRDLISDLLRGLAGR
eukprot:15018697-Alexandrium_andersonii.AAC.1